MRLFTKAVLLLIIAFAIGQIDALAYAGGSSGVTTGKTSTTSVGCGTSGCHGSSSSTTSLSRTSGSTTVNTGSTTTFTIQVAHSSASAAGVNIAVKTDQTGSTNAGTLTEDESGLQMFGGEVTHNTPKSISGGSATFTVSWTAPTTAGTYYLRAIGNAVNSNGNSSGDNYNWMSPVAITVSAAATLSLNSPTSSTNWCAGTTQNITWSSTGVTSVNIEASPDGVNYGPIGQNVSAAAGTFSYPIPSNTPAGNQYRIRISDASNSSLNSVSNPFTISTAPVITSQPVTSQTVCSGQPVTMTVTATGGANTYQWFKDNQQISGATNSTYIIPAAGVANAGTYKVVVSSPCGASLTSNDAALSVSPPTVITSTFPLNQTICIGQSFTLNATATGSNLTYQWKKGGTLIPGETTPTLTVTVTGTQQEGAYAVAVTGSCGTVQSDPSIVTAGKSPSITAQPASQTAIVGSNVTFKVTAADATTYQWRKDGLNINNATSATLNLTNVQAADAGDYDVRITNNCGALASTVAKLTVAQPGIGAVLSVPATIEFGTIKPNEPTEKTLEVKNTGDSVLKVTSVTIAGANASRFAINSGGAPFDVAPNAVHNIVLRFNGTEVTNYTATVSFTSNAKTSSTVTLNGTVASVPGPVLTIASGIKFDTTEVSTKSTQNVVMLNAGNAPAILTSVTIEGPDASQFKLTEPFIGATIEPSAELQLSVEFIPTAEGDATAFLIIKAGEITASVTLNGTAKLGTSVNELPEFINALQVMPNPVMDRAIVSVTFEKSALVEVQVADMTGRIIRTLAPMSMLSSGAHTFVWDRTNDAGQLSASGMYRIIIRGASGIVTMPVVIAD